MGKVVRTVLKIASIAVVFVPGLGVLAKAAITIGLSLLNAALAPKSPKVSAAQRDRLFATIDPSTPRKSVLGATAMATDIRYEEWGGSDQEYLDRIIACASHKVQAIDEIWIEDKLAWTAGGGVQGSYVGYLTVNTRLEGTSANTIAINGGSKWGSSRRLTGCAYVHMRFKTTGNSKKAESPFASSIPQRLTIKGKGALMYDPRKDSSVGGSGTQRANDQTTWAWVSDDVGNNPALQILWYMLGWRINGKLAVGRGIPPARIDMASFIAAANLCDESVALAAGGTERRYRSAGVVSEADAATAVLEALVATCAGTIRDAGGKLSLSVLYNDLSAPVTTFTDDDVINGFDWQPTRGIAFNEVRGRFTDPSNNALYQLVDYPAVRMTPTDGMERPHPFDLSMVQSASQAQRLAKQELQRAQYAGVFQAEFKATGWRCQVGQVVRLTFSPLGFVNKLFRVTEQVIRMDGICPMVLREENAAIYAWSAEEAAAVQAAAPTVYDPLNSPLIAGIEQANQYIDGTPIDDLRPSMPGATADRPGDDLQRNASFDAEPDPDGGLPGWTEMNWTAGQQVTRASDAGASGGYTARIQRREMIMGDPFATAPTVKLFYRLRFKVLKGKAGTTGGADRAEILATLQFFASDGVTLITEHVVTSASYAFSGAYVAIDGSVATPANAFVGRAVFKQDEAYPASLSDVLIDNFDVSLRQMAADVTSQNTAAAIVGQGSGATANSLSGLNAGEGAKLAAIEAGADITRDFDGPAQVSINFDYTGTPEPSQIPRAVPYKLLLSGVDVTGAATWGAPVIKRGGGTFSMGSGGSAGVLTISALSADTELRLPVTHNGISRSCMVQVRRFLADPPRTLNSAADNSFLTVSSGSMTAVSDELEVEPGVTGGVRLSASLSFLTDLTAVKTVYVAIIAQRWNGSAWVDIGTENPASFPCETRLDAGSGVYYTFSNGIVILAPNPTFVSGLSGPQKFRLRARIYSGTGPCYLEGTFAADGI